MSSSLLKTKLYIPPVRPELVSRPRLVERLNAGLGRKLTLVSAPAGFGKTTLLSEWVPYAECHEPGVRFAWFSLDEGDNDPMRFWNYFINVLQTVEKSIGESALAILQSSSAAPIEAALPSLINDITTLPHPFVLILDDYHLIRSPPIHQHLTFLLEHQPPQMHIAIATREDPPLPLSRLRARGHMVEVRQDELRFTEQEATDFLWRVTQRELSSADISALRQRTEGWIVGLQLTALSLRGCDDVHCFVESFAGSHRYILDYLMEEVFQQQSAEVQDFLLKTSILDRFTASLCDAVCSVGTNNTRRDDSHHMLLALEQANLFIIPLDESRQWYRYHHLFADLLRQQLRTVGMQGLVPLLHKRASRWYEAEGFNADAIQHALSGSDWERAATFLNDVGEAMLKRGEVVTLLGWFRALPDEVVHADPELCNLYSWPLILTEQIDAAEFYLERAERGSEDASFLGGIAVARVHIARARGDVRRTIELSERALSLLSQDDLSARSIVAVNLGIAQWYSGRLAKTEQALAEAQRAAVGSENDYVRCVARIFMSRIHKARGKLRQAAASYRQIIQQDGHSPIATLAHYDLAKLLYEWDDLAAAVEHLERGLELSRRSGGAQFLAEGYSTLGLVRQAQGEPSAAQAALLEANRLLEHSGVSPGTHMSNLADRIQVALAQGDLGTAMLAVEQSPKLEDAGSFPDYLSLLLAHVRLYLAQQRQMAALERLATLQGMASQAGWQSVAIQARALQALAMPTSDDALAVLREVLVLAEHEGYVRTFVDSGEPMGELLHQVAIQGLSSGYVTQLLVAIGAKEQRSRGAEEIKSASAPLPSGPPASPLIEPLSDRELQALRLLADGHTNQEMAKEMCVSINTIKAHLKNIYSKLGVHKRRQAVATARELGLLS